ncbi:MAG: hypothetical protein ABSD76_06735 [Terriglobales bacterium]|jgi:hypothetical protein
MNLTKAAAVLALMVALAAAADLIYESTVVRNRYNSAHLSCMNCTAVKEALAANWRVVESNIELLKAKGENREAEKFARDHAAEKPISIDVPCLDCDTPAPDYSMPSAVAAVGLIASRVLFGAVKPRK